MDRIRRMPTATFVSVALLLIVISHSSAESTVAYLDGRLTVERNGGVIEAEIGTDLREGDRLTTGPGSLAILDLEERGTLKLLEDTVLVLENLGNSMSVALDTGSLFSKIRRLAGRGYDVRTPNVVAGVRGTEFFIAYGRTIEDLPDVWLCVNEGSVEVALEDSGDSVLVNEGEGINILSGRRLTDPKSYSWTRDLNWNMNPESGNVLDEADLSSAYEDLRDFDYD